ncbi:MAG: 7-carboxy-7-deazaguanine synthase [Candidatus Cloacimonetes bacterium]|nr:7-carboxy-7-deazaguanine synthase [Candidatus Cloacimonadota bacterium]
MAYLVKEMYYTIQGEGRQSGTPAVFCRMAGCNLWNGHESGRASAVCTFCDTDFLGTDGPGGARFDSADELAAAALALQPEPEGTSRLIVLTGGEPLLQVDDALLQALHAAGFRVAVETNGSLHAPPGLDWICVSPKAGAPFVQRSGQELKLVFPQPALMPDALPHTQFEHYLLQPMDGPERERNTELAVAWCLAHPRWALSLQTHKLLGLP